jgi:hypothetical protein
MITFQIRLEEFGRDWRTLHPRIARAVSYGLNNGGRKVFTTVRRGLYAKIGATRYSTVTSRTYNIPASVGLLAFTIVVRGRPIPIKEFAAHRVGSGVEATPWAAGRVFARSFQQKTSGGGYIPGAFMARIEEDREPIRRLLGPNLAKELLGITRDDQTIPDLFLASARLEVPPAILRAVAAALE